MLVCHKIVSPRQVRKILFVPYALHDQTAYATLAREKLESLGKSDLSLIHIEDGWVIFLLQGTKLDDIQYF